MKWIPALLLAAALAGPAHALEAPLDTKQSFLKFTGRAFLHNFNGEAKEFSGSAEINAPTPQTVLSAKIDIETASLTTFESARDKNMFAWLHVDANPAIHFKLKRVIPQGDPTIATREHPCLFTVQGDFTLNQVTKPLQVQAQGWVEGKLLFVTGTTQITTTDYGLPIVQQYLMTVDKRVDISYRLVFDLPG